MRKPVNDTPVSSRKKRNSRQVGFAELSESNKNGCLKVQMG